MITTDRFDITQSFAAEHIARRIAQLEAAVRRNPKNPDFDNLHYYMAHVPEAGMGAHLPDFGNHVAESMRNDAQIMKSHRLAQEEQEAQAKKKKEKAGPKAKSKKQE